MVQWYGPNISDTLADSCLISLLIFYNFWHTVSRMIGIQHFTLPIHVRLTAATLSKAGHLTFVECMVLWNIYISRIPPDSLASLATRVNWRVDINNVIGDLTPIVGNIKCEVLSISNVYLSSEVIPCLVTAMRNNVVGVVVWVMYL